MGNVEANRQLEERTLLFAVTIVRFVATFPHSETGIVVGRQLLKSGTSVGANYREANRAESRDDFQHKTAVVLKEPAETDYWLELCTTPSKTGSRRATPSTTVSLSFIWTGGPAGWIRPSNSNAGRWRHTTCQITNAAW